MIVTIIYYDYLNLYDIEKKKNGNRYFNFIIEIGLEFFICCRCNFEVF